ncbi:MAG: phosphate/phosphite/phosphonate ABC transporter substrate-binding protein [Cypionkella sp.]
MIASLGMYDRAETAGAHDRLWALIRDALRDAGEAAPDALTRVEGAYWQAWQSPDLVFSQTCGFPYRAKLHDHVTLIGTPDYGIEGCPPGHYASIYVARANDPRALAEFDGAAFAYNEPMSQSGWAAPQNHAAHLGLHFPPSVQSGSHRLSALAVAEGRADLAAIDPMTWALLTRYEPWTAKLRKVTQTEPPTPTLPYITAKGRDADLYFAAATAAIAALSPADREILHLKGLIRIPAADYLAVPIPQTPYQIAQTE